MVDRKRIVGPLLDDLLELLRRPVIVHVVEPIESGFGLRIAWNPGGRGPRLAHRRKAGRQDAEKQCRRGKKEPILPFVGLCLVHVKHPDEALSSLNDLSTLV